ESVIKRIIRVRMEKARLRLNENQLRISDISEQVGYRSVSYFSNVFKKYYGTSPQEYRKNHSVKK
ncbi:MAG: helix-turn-helix transcriptional regulator, partial [Lachnospiraceae bacterium]|nr:helix-turn-helix transcriptional regulator [Lachnospiraceae bacterium]